MKKIRTWHNGSFSPLARIKLRLMDKSKRLGRELEGAGKEGTSGTHNDNTSCLMIFKLKVIFQCSPVGFNDASVLDMIAFKKAHKSVHVSPRFPLNFEIRNSYIKFPLRLLKNMLAKL